MEDDPPSGAKVSFDANWGANGWDAPELAPWLEKSLEDGSNAFFGKPSAFMGEGGTIPFMAMLGERFPQGAVSHYRRPGTSCQRARAQ